jgi:hypothetical protein
MNIHNECTFLKPEGIAKIENMYNAKYVFESCLKTRTDGWSNYPVAIFYTEQAHPRGSNYMGLYVDEYGRLLITDGIAATEPFDALQIGEDIIYSRYRHDYREFKGAMVDGGRDYFKRSADRGVPVKLKVVGDHLEVVENAA